MKQSGICLLLLNFVNFVICDNHYHPCRNSSELEFVNWRYNERLQGHTFLTYSPSAESLCLMKCRQYMECQSVNFNRDTLVCELNDVNSTTNSEDIRTIANYWFNEYDKTTTLPCQDGTCSRPTRCANLYGGGYRCLHDCPQGTRKVGDKCVCPIGSYASSNDHFGTHNCLDCPAGYFQNQEGQEQCEPCVAGKYQDELGQTSCKICPAGTYTATTAQSACTPCPVGRYQGNSGQTSCNQCQPGRYQNSQGQTSCSLCPRGKMQPYSGQTTCVSCSAGTYQPSTGRTSCSNCPAGKYQAYTGQYNCNSCSPGQYQDNTGSTSCKYCSAGTYMPNSGYSHCWTCSTSTSQGDTTCV